MLREFCYIYLLILTISFTSLSSTTAQERSVPVFRMIFYNTENLFDTLNDSLKDDDDFLPTGLMRWNYSRYVSKINSIYKVLTAAGNPEPPVIAGLCEIENRSVLEALIFDTYLSRFNYGIVHEESNDPRGIDVGLIYRKDILNLICYKKLVPSGNGNTEFRSRNVLYTKFLIDNDTIHIFLNHWPSRRSGVLAGEDERINISRMIKEKTDSINISVSGKGKIIIAGDFNCSPDDIEMGLLMGNRDKKNSYLTFVNLATGWSQKGLGTYKFRGTWEMLDQVLVSESLLKTFTGICTEPDLFKVFSPDFLVTSDPAYPGIKPFSTFNGYRYQGGFSDHLPVILDLKCR